MKKILLAALFAALPLSVSAAEVSGSGDQPYACTVISNSSITLVSTGNNELTATGSGSFAQNGNTTYTMSAATTTGPDVNLQDVTTVTGGSVSLSVTESAGDSQAITGELDQTVTYRITLSSSDGTLEAGSYTSSSDLTCAATP